MNQRSTKTTPTATKARRQSADYVRASLGHWQVGVWSGTASANENDKSFYISRAALARRTRWWAGNANGFQGARIPRQAMKAFAVRRGRHDSAPPGPSTPISGTAVPLAVPIQTTVSHYVEKVGERETAYPRPALDEQSVVSRHTQSFEQLQGTTNHTTRRYDSSPESGKPDET